MSETFSLATFLPSEASWCWAGSGQFSHCDMDAIIKADRYAEYFFTHDYVWIITAYLHGRRRWGGSKPLGLICIALITSLMLFCCYHTCSHLVWGFFSFNGGKHLRTRFLSSRGVQMATLRLSIDSLNLGLSNRWHWMSQPPFSLWMPWNSIFPNKYTLFCFLLHSLSFLSGTEMKTRFQFTTLFASSGRRGE